jgi:hypothetical protein
MNQRGHRRNRSLIFGLWSLLFCFCTVSYALLPRVAHEERRSKTKVLVAEKGLEMPVQERARIRAPELTGGRGWLNTDKPLSLAALKGKLCCWIFGPMAASTACTLFLI